MWSVENPHGPPRAGRAVTSAPEARRGGGGSSLGLGILLGTRSGAWRVQSTLAGRVCVGQRHWGRTGGRGGARAPQRRVAAVLPRPALTLRSSCCGVAEGMGAPNSSPTPSLVSFLHLLRAGDGRMPHPRFFRPTCAPCLSLRLAGIPGSPGSRRQQTGRVELGWGWEYGGGLSPPRCVASSCWSQGHSRTAISPPRDRRTRAQGLGTGGRGVSARAGLVPGLQSLPHPPRGGSPSRALSGASASEARREPSPRGEHR